MKKKNSNRSSLFVYCFILILLFPFIGVFPDHFISLGGVTQDTSVESPTMESVLEGTTQSEVNNYIENHFWGRKTLIKLRSQLLYSLFNESPNSNVLIEKDKYLFEPEYIYRELNIYPVSDEAYYDELMEKLNRIDKLCLENNKEMYIFITPSKAYFCKDKISSEYHLMENGGENDYSRFVRYLSNSNLKYFDSHKYIDEHIDEIDAPVFYSTGIHWSQPWGNRCAIEFKKYIEENSKWDLSEATQQIEKCKKNKPVAPDTDLYDSLNLIVPAMNDTFFKSNLTVTEEKDVPSVFLRGGSFMGQSLSALENNGIFNTVAHYENNYIYLNNGAEARTFSAFDAYDEFDDMGEYLSKSDILILEVNEAHVSRMSFGFIDYLLENPQLLTNK
ncbi:hypothetical protein [Butyrivibrio sp. WCE2006]|uniref:hypothetical protein n=1 Tax=Butyrivibrio sp. WCE2006 TaxID=1410611 RepID=UPI0012DBE588|nr:hypothetical protein [Butyrivibrio sp. WCE2006]